MKKQLNEANKHYDDLENYECTRYKEITNMAEPYIKITEQYGRLISHLVIILGSKKPNNIQDIVVRDLMADVFDCLYESRSLILKGNLNVTFPIARRAYESLSLLHLCIIDESWAEKWDNGKKIGNSEVRKKLAAHQLGEPESEMKELYNFYCSATHPNRELIPKRFLGEANEYVLGAIGAPDLVMILDYCIKNLEMWFWLTATVTYFYKEIITAENRDYFDAYNDAAKDSQKTKAWLITNYKNVLKEAQEYWKKSAPKNKNI